MHFTKYISVICVQIMNTLAYMPLTHSKAVAQDAHLMAGMTEALQALCQPTSQQLKLIDSQQPLVNNGVVICLTHVRG